MESGQTTIPQHLQPEAVTAVAHLFEQDSISTCYTALTKLSPTRGLCLCLRCATSRLSAAQWLSAIRSLQRLPSRLWSSTSRLCPAAQLWLCPSPCGLCPTGGCLWRGLWGTPQLWCTAAQLWRAATGLWGATGLWSSIWLWSHLFFSTRVRSVREDLILRPTRANFGSPKRSGQRKRAAKSAGQE